MEHVFRATTPIKYPGYREELGHSTGFFLRTNYRGYLVTCKHALFEIDRDTYSFRPETIAIRIRDEDDYEKTRTKKISLYNESGEPNWIEPYHYHADIAALPLDFSLSDTGNSFYGSVNLGINYHPDSSYYSNTRPGHSAVVAGYPIINSTDYAPILRDALISSPITSDLDNRPYFLIDAKLHPGTSGSPVMVRYEDEENGSQLKLLGVHSGRYNQIEEGSENLNRVWLIRHLQLRLIDIEPSPTEQW